MQIKNEIKKAIITMEIFLILFLFLLILPLEKKSKHYEKGYNFKTKPNIIPPAQTNKN